MPKGIVFFPGQGSQFVGMGRDLVENFPIARQTFEEASDAISDKLDRLCFEGPDADLALTKNTQPCLLTASIAAYRVATSEFGLEAEITAGHSLGEYSALVANGALQFSDAVKWVRKRGEAMQRAVPEGKGGMIAIMGVEDEKIRDFCDAAVTAAETSAEKACVLEAANFNSPGQIVLAGTTDAIQEAVAVVKSGKFKGAKGIPLKVSAPFHCSLMVNARDEMAEIFENSDDSSRPSKMNFPYVPNVTGKSNDDPQQVFELLVRQIDHPVLWTQTVKMLIQKNHETAFEVGPGKVLQGLAKRISKAVSKPLPCLPAGDLESLKKLSG